MKVAFVDHSFHRKTLSSKFLADILRRHGMEVDLYWDDSWQGGEGVCLDGLLGSYDAFVFFQIPARSSRPYGQLDANITFVPMLDSYRGSELGDRLRLRPRFDGVKFLNFSSSLHAIIGGHDLETMHVRYFPDPLALDFPMPEALSGFLWQRRPDAISTATVEKLIGDAPFESIHVHLPADPPHSPLRPYSDGPVRHRVSSSEWVADAAEYRRHVAAASVFFAPRPLEGIGMSVLEAMGMGRCVVAPDAGTMNEYIIHGENGLLYDIAHPAPLDFSRAKEIGRAARRSIEAGHEAWISREGEIADFVARPPAKIRGRMSTVATRLARSIRRWSR